MLDKLKKVCQDISKTLSNVRYVTLSNTLRTLVSNVLRLTFGLTYLALYTLGFVTVHIVALGIITFVYLRRVVVCLKQNLLQSLKH